MHQTGGFWHRETGFSPLTSEMHQSGGCWVYPACAAVYPACITVSLL